jgi:hypothetical protein
MATQKTAPDYQHSLERIDKMLGFSLEWLAAETRRQKRKHPKRFAEVMRKHKSESPKKKADGKVSSSR